MFCRQDEFIFKCKLACVLQTKLTELMVHVKFHSTMAKIWASHSLMKMHYLWSMWAQSMYMFNRIKFIFLNRLSINFSNIPMTVELDTLHEFIFPTLFIFVLQNYFGKGKTTSTNVVNIYRLCHKILIGNSAENILKNSSCPLGQVLLHLSLLDSSFIVLCSLLEWVKERKGIADSFNKLNYFKGIKWKW